MVDLRILVFYQYKKNAQEIGKTNNKKKSLGVSICIRYNTNQRKTTLMKI
jgi:hypothetical protein